MFSASSIRTAMAFAAVLRAGLLAVPPRLSASSPPPFFATSSYARVPRLTAAARAVRYRRRGRPSRAAAAITASSLDLTEDMVRLALEEAIKLQAGRAVDSRRPMELAAYQFLRVRDCSQIW
jgi:hypothetical protein